jgi:hypothetical protein
MKKQNMTVEEIRAATTSLNNQRGAMHFLQPVPPEVRSQTKRIGPKTVQLADKRYQAARQHVESMPASFDFRGFERDIALMQALSECRDAAMRILDELQDTLNQVGARGAHSAAEAYAYMRTATKAGAGLHHTVDTLSIRRAKSATKEVSAEASTAALAAPAAVKTPQAQPPAPPSSTPAAPEPNDKKAA